MTSVVGGGYKVEICCRTWQQHGSHKALSASAIQLQCYHEQLSSVSCNIKCQNTAVSTGADGRNENDSGVFPLEGKKLRHIHTPGPHWSCVLFNFYKSSSARQEKTRPVAKLSTTLQPYFRSHLNATCAVCVRTYMGEELRKNKPARINFRGFLCVSLPADVPGNVSAVSEPFL